MRPAAALLLLPACGPTDPAGKPTDISGHDSGSTTGSGVEGGADTTDGGAGTDGASDGATDGASDSGTDGATDTGSGPDWEPWALLSLNLHCFKTEDTPYPDNDARFAAIASLVAAEPVQVILVQEACENAGEGVAMARLADALHAATGDTWGTAWTETHPAWTGTPDEAIEGVGLLLRGASPDGVEVFTYSVQGTQLRRSISATLPTRLGGFRVTSVHLDHGDADARRAQARQEAMRAILDTGPGSLIAGDFNALPGEAPMLDLVAAGLTLLSAPADPAGVEIDHLIVRPGSPVQATASRMVFTGATEAPVSDHPGLLVHLAPAPAAPTLRTSMSATFTTTDGHYLALRGDRSPLSWDLGWPAIQVAPDRWEAALLTVESGTLNFKWLYDDTTWEEGPDHPLTAGEAIEVTPTF